MKILITTDWDIPTVNGVVTSVRNLCRVLRQIGHDVRILTLRQSDSQEKQDKDTWNLHSIGIGKIYPQAEWQWDSTVAFGGKFWHGNQTLFTHNASLAPFIGPDGLLNIAIFR